MAGKARVAFALSMCLMTDLNCAPIVKVYCRLYSPRTMSNFFMVHGYRNICRRSDMIDAAFEKDTSRLIFVSIRDHSR